MTAHRESPLTLPRIAAPWLALALCLSAAGSLRAETCTIEGVGDWTAVCSFAGPTLSGCTCDAGDAFEIEGDVTIPAGAIVSQDGTTPNTGVEVESGGSLTLEAGAILRLNEDGLDCDAGSTCAFLGEYLAPDGTGLHDDPLAAGAWTVAAPIPCPTVGGVEGCATTGDPATVRLALAAPNAGLSAAVVSQGALPAETSGDLLWFWPFENADPRDEGMDSLFPYEVVAVAPGAATLDFSVRQGQNDQDGYPFARREIASFVSSEAVAPGDAEVEFAAGTLAANGYYDGRMFRWVASGEPRRITRTRVNTNDCPVSAGPCDVIQVASRGGFDAARAPGERFLVEYGWEPGDAFLVLRPARVERATATERDAPVHLRGQSELRGVLFDRIRHLQIYAAPTACDHLWLRDPTDGNGSGLGLQSAIDCDGLVVTGGSELATPDCDSGARDDCTHTIVAQANATMNLSNVAIRHGGDDAFSIGSGTSPTVDFDGVRVQFSSEQINQSMQCIAGSIAEDEIIRIRDLECLDASRDGPILNPNRGADTFEVEGLVAIANKNGISSHDRNTLDPDYAEGTLITHATILGAQMASSNGNAIPSPAENFVVRLTDAPNGQLFNGGPGFSRNGLVTDNRYSLATVIDFRWDDDWSYEMENVAWWNNAGAGSAIFVVADPFEVTFRRTLFSQYGNTDDPAEEFFRIRNDADVDDLGGFTLEGVAFTHGTGQPMLDEEDPQASLSDMTLADLCFWNNNIDTSDPAAMPVGTITGVDPQFVDLANGRLDVPAGSAWDVAGCGVDRGAFAPGVRGYRRVHAWSNLEPELMADDVDGDGVPEDPTAPVCLDEAAHGCSDNCPGVFNPNQLDVDADGAGNACSPECANGIDDDGDGFADYPADPDCAAYYDPFEVPEPSFGVGLALGVAALAARRTRKA